MLRSCTYCSNPGHNSRTCPNRGIKIFGVRLTNGAIVKSDSTRNIRRYVAARAPEEAGYTSEANRASRERKKGVRWTEEEHIRFLEGLRKLGRGDWCGIARNYVATRTPIQVASHAQKFFIRQNSGSSQNSGSRRKRRTSLFDLAPTEIVDAPVRSLEPDDVHGNTAQPVPPALEKESDARDSNSNSSSNDGDGSIPKGSLTLNYPVLYPTFVTPSYPYFSFQYWSGYNAEPKEQRAHEILKPTTVRAKSPKNIDELMGMSKLNLEDAFAAAGPSFLPLKQPDGSVRQSAFRVHLVEQ